MRRLLVRDWMTPDPITVDLETTLPAAYRIMKLNNIRRLPVVGEGSLVGIITDSDVFRLLLEQLPAPQVVSDVPG